MINILFTSGGRRVELLRAFRRAYESLGLKGNIITVDVDPLAPALQVADHFFIVPRVSSPNYVRSIIEICNRKKANLIFPLIDPDIPLLAQNRRDIENTGARLYAVSSEAAAVADDKWLTVQFFKRLGLFTPDTWLPHHINSIQVRYPIFIKPRAGSAAKLTFRAEDARELEFFLNYVPDPLIQEFLPGPEITNDVICDIDGEVLAVVSRQRIEVRWGEVAKGKTIYDPNITEACVKIARTLPAIGPITVQCMMKDGVPYFTEINARLGGGVPLGISAGVDSPRWLLARAAGIQIQIPPLGTYKKGLYISRFDDSFFLTEDEYEQMASRHL